MFNLDQLTTLRAVVEDGTVAAAAARLGYTPSAVSQQLSRLEADARQVLMRRQGRNIVPTDAAHVLVRVAAEMASLEERARAELELLTHRVSGAITLAAFPTAVRGISVAAIAALHECHPGVTVTLRDAPPEPGLAGVSRGDLDLAIIHDWTEDHLQIPSGVATSHLGTDPVDLVLPVGHRLAGQAVIDIADLDGENWVNDSPGICSRQLLQSLRDRALDYRISCVLDDYQSQVTATAYGLGLSLLPRLGREPLPDTVVAVPLVDPPTRRILVAYRRDSEQRPALGALLRELGAAWARVAG